mgnify:CR=1 FL=1
MSESIPSLKRRIGLLEDIQRNIQDSFFTDEERLQVDRSLSELQQELFEQENLQTFSQRMSSEEAKQIQHTIRFREDILNRVFGKHEHNEDYMNFFKDEHMRLRRSLESD